MVRTKADAATSRVSAAKAPRKVHSSPASNDKKSAFNSSKGGGGGGNAICPRETPAWQKEITKFFTVTSKAEDGELNKSESSSSNREINDACGIEKNDSECDAVNDLTQKSVDENGSSEIASINIEDDE